MSGEPEVLDEHIIYKSGSFVRKRRWLRGAHPHLGTIILGLTGLETVQIVETIIPMGTFRVIERPLRWD